MDAKSSSILERQREEFQRSKLARVDKDPSVPEQAASPEFMNGDKVPPWVSKAKKAAKKAKQAARQAKKVVVKKASKPKKESATTLPKTVSLEEILNTESATAEAVLGKAQRRQAADSAWSMVAHAKPIEPTQSEELLEVQNKESFSDASFSDLLQEAMDHNDDEPYGEDDEEEEEEEDQNTPQRDPRELLNALRAVPPVSNVDY